MRNTKIKKFKKFKDALLYKAGGSIIAGMMVIGGNTAFAQVNESYVPSSYEQLSSKTHKTSAMRRWNSGRKISSITRAFGLDVTKVKGELREGKTLKEVLKEYDIDTTNIVNNIVQS